MHTITWAAASRWVQQPEVAVLRSSPAPGASSLFKPAPSSEPAAPCCWEPLPWGSASALLPCPKPPLPVPQLSRSSAHLLQTITPITMDTSTISPAMATTAMMRTGFCSLEATVTAGGKQSWLATRPGAGPRHGAALAAPPAPACILQQGCRAIHPQCQAAFHHPHNNSHPGSVVRA